MLLRNTSRAQSYLHIPNFSYSDQGLYACELASKGDAESYDITVTALGKT